MTRAVSSSNSQRPAASGWPGCCCSPGDWAWPETLATETPAADRAGDAASAQRPAGRGPRPLGGAARSAGVQHPHRRPGPAGRPARTIFSDPDGCIYDMNVSYDARTLFFSYRRQGRAVLAPLADRHRWLRPEAVDRRPLSTTSARACCPTATSSSSPRAASATRSASRVRPRTCTACRPTAATSAA